MLVFWYCGKLGDKRLLLVETIPPLGFYGEMDGRVAFLKLHANNHHRSSFTTPSVLLDKGYKILAFPLFEQFVWEYDLYAPSSKMNKWRDQIVIFWHTVLQKQKQQNTNNKQKNKLQNYKIKNNKKRAKMINTFLLRFLKQSTTMKTGHNGLENRGGSGNFQQMEVRGEKNTYNAKKKGWRV